MSARPHPAAPPAGAGPAPRLADPLLALADRCEEGPVVVIYPEGTWYTYADLADVDEIVDEHLLHGRVVKRLQI